MLPPLNGTKTHPLTDFAKKALGQIAKHPVPRQEVNPGVVNRLLRECLVESIELPSPYQKHKGGGIEFLKITKAGVDRLIQI
jgi:hypothetical protein